MTTRTHHDRRPASTWLVLAAATLLSPSVLAAPVLEVRLDGVILGNNQEVTLPPTALGESSPMVIVLRNIGDEGLVFTNDPPVFVFGGFAEQYSLIQPPLESGSKLSPNGSTAFRVDFSPVFVRERIDTRCFIFTNASAAPFALTLTGRGKGPVMVVKQAGSAIADDTAFEFSPTPIGESTTVQFVIENQGDLPLLLTGDPLVQVFGGFDFDFAVVELPAEAIPAGQSSTFSISFAPTLERLYSTRLFIHNNEKSLLIQELYAIDLTAEGVPAIPNDPPPGDDQNGQTDPGDPNQQDDQGQQNETEDPQNDPEDQPQTGDDAQQNDTGDTGGQQTDDAVDGPANDAPNDDSDDAGDESGGQAGDLDDAGGNAKADGGGNADDRDTDDLNDAHMAMCGFGAPLGLLGCMLTLTGVRCARRRR